MHSIKGENFKARLDLSHINYKQNIFFFKYDTITRHMNMFGKRVLNFDLLITCLTNIKHQGKNIILHKPFHLFFST